VKKEEVIVGGNSSLQLMYYLIDLGWRQGFVDSPRPWRHYNSLKFLCPVPGYDRHFRVTEYFGFQMINIPMTENGPDMDMVEELVKKDDSVKGIWCVPVYSNPDGYCYSDETVRRLARMQTAAPDFKIIWDNAYIVHHLTDEICECPNILTECKAAGNAERPLIFCSTSKITYPGAGVAALAASESNIQNILQNMMPMIISFDKMNQLRHVQFLKDKQGVLEHMKKHRAILEPKFNLVKETFAAQLSPCGEIAHWTNPKGGYFLSLYVEEGCAKRVAQLCKDAGLTLTGAGASFPYGLDPKDEHLRIAPTYPKLAELEKASMLLTICVRLATVEKLLHTKK
jgi:DNA-binding transcriptional MocR family regulator